MRLRGLLFPSKGPHLFLISSWDPLLTRIPHRSDNPSNRLNLRYRSDWVDTPQYWNLRLPEHVLDFRFF